MPLPFTKPTSVGNSKCHCSNCGGKSDCFAKSCTGCNGKGGSSSSGSGGSSGGGGPSGGGGGGGSNGGGGGPSGGGPSPFDSAGSKLGGGPNFAFRNVPPKHSGLESYSASLQRLMGFGATSVGSSSSSRSLIPSRSEFSHGCRMQGKSETQCDAEYEQMLLDLYNKKQKTGTGVYKDPPVIKSSKTCAAGQIWLPKCCGGRCVPIQSGCPKRC